MDTGSHDDDDDDASEISSEDSIIDNIANGDNIDDDISDSHSPESRLLMFAKTGNVAGMKALLSSSRIDANAISKKEAASQG